MAENRISTACFAAPSCCNTGLRGGVCRCGQHIACVRAASTGCVMAVNSAIRHQALRVRQWPAQPASRASVGPP
jgi:hypothetical protein